MKKILILHTGGTISMAEDESGHVSPNAVNPLTQLVLPSTKIEIVSEDIFNLPSPHITLEHMLTLKNRITTAFGEGFDGIVITHGTDTLEETAFFLDSTIKRGKPIIITGAMRSSNELGTDGIYNLQTAIRVAADDDSHDRGVLVVMNDEIHSARYVTKTHTTNVSTFQTPTHGPLGLLTKNKIFYFHRDSENQHLDIHSVSGKVPIVKCYAGMNGEIFDLLDVTTLDGLVLEALGAGNIPPAASHSLKRIIEAQVPIVLVSRCFNGIAEPVYDYDGGGSQLHQAGVMFAPEVNSQKARIKLVIGLNAGVQDLPHFMEN
ncbi:MULTISPECIES: asparaginase [unclassified Lactococcus]|uniref:asparaginase n=1 Tax=unclassified Lactococcus TaxID=2643510 RepID=UPI0011C90B61|nr:MULTISPECIES: asparaginase [unclassified Lactococcus]MQW22544.1 asparaginase [Lactococcus sp. dk101]TXK45567.1 asparaginase [Lactococcus sp. dk310]TXK51417.1 asparaginase [Lactococcus sp. dk322]